MSSYTGKLANDPTNPAFKAASLPPRSLKSQAMRGGVWVLIGHGTGQVLRLASNVVLAHLLFPRAFGLMLMVNAVMRQLQMFSDVGVRQSIIQSERGDDPIFYNTAWTVQIIRGMLIAVCAAVVAVPFARFYDEPDLAWLIPAVATTALIAGLQSTAQYTLNRHLQIGKITLLATLAQIATISVMVGWALFDRSVRSLAVGSIAGAILTVVLSHRLIPGYKNRITWDREAFHELHRFGKWIFIATVLSFLAGSADKFILGKLDAIGTLGVYGIAIGILDAPRTLILKLNRNVVFPAISRKQHLPRPELRRKILHNRKRLIYGTAVAIAVLAALGDYPILWFYDHRYEGAAWMLSILAIGLWPRMLFNTIAPTLMALGMPGYNATGSALRLVIVGVGMPIGYYFGDLPGAIMVVSLGDVPNYVVAAYGLWRHGLSSFMQDFLSTVLFVVVLATVIGARVAMGLGTPFALAT